ncbi:unnamed protein product [Diamesa serratosioi]
MIIEIKCLIVLLFVINSNANKSDIIVQSRVPRAITNSNCGTHGTSNGLILGGRNFNRGLWPWKVALFEVENRSRDFFCGGILISSHSVITAAHCMQPKGQRIIKSPEQVLLAFGVYNLNDFGNPGTVSSYAIKINIHPDWNPSTNRYDADLALLQIENSLLFTNLIKPVCLWNGDDSINSVEGSVVGWGKSESSKKHEDEPKEISVPIVSNEVCFLAQPELSSISSVRTFCGGSRDGVRGPCFGDSGSGLFVKNGQKYYLRGLVSSSLTVGEICDTNSYAIYTNIFKFTDWITQNAMIDVSHVGKVVPARCHYYEHAERGYTCELSGANIRDESDIINISGSHIEGRNDDDVIYLNLEKSTFEVVPTNLCQKFYRISKIDMWNVGLKKLSEQSFTSCPNLISLGIGNNKLTKLPANAFKYLRLLNTLAVDGNPMVEIEKDAFNGLDNLKVMYMSYTKMTEIKEHTFAPLYKLEFIQLFHNQFDTIHPNAFTSLTKLWYLNLEKSNLKEIGPDVFKPLISLKELYLHYNQIDKIHPKAFKTLVNLRVLSIKGNKVSKLTESIFQSQSKLEDLFLQDNKIVNIELGIFNRLTALKTLDVRDNVCVDRLFENVKLSNVDIVPFIRNCIIE